MLTRNDCSRRMDCQWIARSAVAAWLLLVLSSITAGTAVSMAGPSARSAASDERQIVSEELLATVKQCDQNVVRLGQQLEVIDAVDVATRARLQQELELWNQLALVVAERTTLHDDLAMDQAQLDDAVPPSPYGASQRMSFLELDDCRNQLQTAKNELEAISIERQSEKVMLDESRQAFRIAEQVRRRALERLQIATPRELPEREREHQLACLRSRVAESQLNLQRERIARFDLEQQLGERKRSNLQATIATHSEQITFSQAELDERLKLIDSYIEKIESQVRAIDSRRIEIGYQAKQGVKEQTVSALENAREEKGLLQRLLSEAEATKKCWRRRYALVNSRPSAVEIADWLAEAIRAKEHIELLSDQLRLRSDLRTEAIAPLLRRQLRGDFRDGNASDVDEQIEELQRMVDVYGSIEVVTSANLRVCSRYIEELQNRQHEFAFSEWWPVMRQAIGSVWNYEVMSVDDASITVSKICCGLGLFLLGFFFCRSAAAIIANRVLPRLGVSPSAVSVFRTLIFYAFLVTLSLFVLDVVHVPLTVFAFLGGAIAIGVGFGSQNLMNNFISGLILLVERPIRAGDLVKIDGISANVEHIGARSTRVRTGENLEILIPNSKFLEANVTNWTLSDTRVRTSITLGVAYGSPVANVISELDRIVRRHELVIQTPEPIVLFRDFADSSLTFEVHFWIHQRRIMEGRIVRSQLRVAIDEAFHAAGIEIAFPQRDVHLDVRSPIEVRMEANPIAHRRDDRIREAA
ncbi:mechanosensitive ion channel domain-containing protein [Novipirellula artificiosorum]|uniref:Mechanosensitive channel MscK n=1 Tax=Novipirellula artificiosorum TaxID=2528016 RepID=A0A5C6DE70_9BACT|nr:mechanosensitive ion channel domain-containing protein [Novipirellula artificiosorum]TWU34485.1 Mechanosensitive channel MscK precursor [Novipirellula artificiosorum]